MRPLSPRSSTGTTRIVLATVLIGLLLTMVFASREQARAARERELEFGREAEAVQQTVTARIDELSSQFETATAFIGSTHPLAPDIYGEFFERTYPERFSDDLSMLLLEEVERDELDALVAREVALGSSNFEVVEAPIPSGGPALVFTRVDGSGEFDSLIGYDIAFARQLVLPDDLAPGGYALQAAEAAALMTATSTTSLSDVADIPDVAIYFVGEVIDREGERIGWAVRFLSPTEFAGVLSVPEELHLRLSVGNVEGPLAEFPYPRDDSVLDLELRERSTIEAASETWIVEVTAHPDFGGATGMLGQVRVLVAGALATLAAACATGAWQHYRSRLAGTSFELAHARTLATTDPLTGLLNRQGLIDGAREYDAVKAAVLYFVDLDGFKQINDRRGHEAGDVVLTEVAVELRACFRRQDLVARLGGDEFVVFAVDAHRPVDHDDLATRVVERVALVDPDLSCSVGVARRAPGAAVDIKDLLREADQAMYRAKRAGGGRFITAGGGRG
ncbi:MAG: GGDEF domain-containing protein [Actinomycetota bacterium]